MDDPHANSITSGDGAPTRCGRPTMEVVYTWPDGREEVRYRRPAGSVEAHKLSNEVLELRRKHGEQCPYSIRFVSTALGERNDAG
jgi:hypothetical protein